MDINAEQEVSQLTFEKFLEDSIAKGGFHNDDIVAIVTPLFEEVLAFHEKGKVAPLDGLSHILITNDKLDIDEAYIEDVKSNPSALTAIDTFQSKAFDIVKEQKVTETITDDGAFTENTMSVETDLTKPIVYPVYLIGYHNYEHSIGHYDELTDIYSLGMILASVSLGLNFTIEEDLNAFAQKRSQLLYLNSKLHPVIANLIVEMTELFRHRRARDLYEIIERLKNYRDYRPENQYDLTVVHGFQKQDVSSKQKWILNKLKSRLFDLSRRNRLLYFRPNLRFINLTAASVPNVVNVTNIKPESLFIWNDEIASKVSAASDIALTKYLRFEDNPYLPAYLDKLRTESERDKKEYGVSQLRVAVCFLNWYNFKEDKNERIQTPLVLIPVQLIRKKGVKDQYILQPKEAEAEINPVLVYLLKETYGLQLPDKIDLAETTVQKLYEELQKQISSNNSGIQLELIDKPRIKIIHTLAKQVLSQYNRKLRNRNTNFANYKNIDYSYKPENYQPLGLQLFRRHVEPRSSYMQWLIDENITAQSPQHFKDEKERTFVTIGDETQNPFRWEFDLCNVVLGNFNYKKMSLVSDYNIISENNLTGEVFDDIFSDTPKEIYDDSSKPSLKDQFPVVMSDPTQTNAVGFSQRHKSYIIQGPPGTGKSQTITNLVADFVARGKKVLFVCEKRAALDVVYFRLKQQNLHELCCLIHDSRGDKKPFIQELKATYDKYLKEQPDSTGLEIERNNLLAEMETQISLLNTYDAGLSQTYNNIGISLRQLINRLIELDNSHTLLDSQHQELVPDYKDWLVYGDLVKKLNEIIRQISDRASWAAHPLAMVNKNVIEHDQPVNYVATNINDIQRLLSEIATDTKHIPIPQEIKSNFKRLHILAKNAQVIKPLATTGNLQLLDRNSARSVQFREYLNQFKQLEEAFGEAQKKNSNWLKKIPESDIPAARDLVEKNEDRFFSFLNGEYRRLKKVLTESYDFSKHAVRPRMKQILIDLEKEYNTLNEQIRFEKQTRDALRIESLKSTELLVDTINNHQSENLFNSFLQNENGNEIALSMAALSAKITDAYDRLQKLLNNGAPSEVSELNIVLEDILKVSNHLPLMLPLLKDLKSSPDNFMQFINRHSLSTTAMEATLAYGNLLKVYDQNHEFNSIDSNAIQRALEKLQELHKKWLRCNAKLILSRQHGHFRKNVARSEASVAGVPAIEREWKRNYNDGRKILENEFGKQMRYKAIRELATGNAGQIIQDIKPVWLMSPLSVSDALPINSSFFDVVIFDEASQITLEEGIPPVFRAKQSIIVGDEMQMPPSNFFGTALQDPDDVFDESSSVGLTLDADSLLIQASRKLPDVMLGWHYRSRYESLISFSNNAFYKAGLLTIPDRIAFRKDLKEIIVANPEEGIKNTTYLFDRSISYHYLSNAIYDQRTNMDEAKYIAHLVLSLLKENCTQSIGVVAFSQEQQTEIEDAIEALGEEWKMTAQLEEAYQRTEDDQFVGIFTKNLENVQGDERDIIIMSICYGYDSNKKMLMNFGPINRKGGEKRLNVIFSRAKKHICVVSSIKHTDIKNEYNEGANYFRKFLQYSSLLSSGLYDDAKSLLNSLSNKTHEKEVVKNIVVDELASLLKTKGYFVDTNLGLSYFKCQLGIRKNLQDETYALGILVDSDEPGKEVMEKFYQRPLTMQTFGWNVIQVWTKDWLHKKEEVLSKILKQL